jgi:hypothetical protein
VYSATGSRRWPPRTAPRRAPARAAAWSRVHVDEHLLDRRGLRTVLGDHPLQLLEDRREPHRQLAVGHADHAAGHVREPATGVALDHAETGEPQAGIDAEDAFHRAR